MLQIMFGQRCVMLGCWLLIRWLYKTDAKCFWFLFLLKLGNKKPGQTATDLNFYQWWSGIEGCRGAEAWANCPGDTVGQQQPSELTFKLKKENVRVRARPASLMRAGRPTVEVGGWIKASTCPHVDESLGRDAASCSTLHTATYWCTSVWMNGLIRVIVKYFRRLGRCTFSVAAIPWQFFTKWNPYF